MQHNSENRRTQRDRLLGLLLEARGSEVSLRQILDLHISQFGSRILELRAMGFNISNRMEIVAGEKRSWYRLQSGPSTPTPAPIAAVSGPSEQSQLFDMSGGHCDRC